MKHFTILNGITNVAEFNAGSASEVVKFFNEVQKDYKETLYMVEGFDESFRKLVHFYDRIYYQDTGLPVF